MRILFIPSYYGGISWWRFEVPAKALRAAGHEVTLPSVAHMSEIYQSGGFKGWLAAQMQAFDIIHVGYSGEPEFAKGLFEVRDKYQTPVITDIDDDVDSVPPYNSGWRTYGAAKTGQRVVKTQMQYSDGVTFSTPPLSEALAKYNPVNAVLDNWVDVDSWDFPTPKARYDDQSIRIMVTGGRARYGDWSIIKEPLELVMAKYDGKEGRPKARLFFLGATPDWVNPWMEDKKDPLANSCTYLQPTTDLLLFNKMVRHVAPDIMLAPVQENSFNRSKSGLKFFESALAGATFICTDFPTYANAPDDCCIKVGNSLAQWQWALEEAITRADWRRELAGRAREYVVDNCQAGHHIIARTEFYERVIERDNGDNRGEASTG